ncbi:hypothetical protein, partial [Methylobacterium nigriterrae]|uniref:hypothetical protein n=1 Tax=Methylobacterium nigriterrae TaxID=3127512 RepID=UPI0030136381
MTEVEVEASDGTVVRFTLPMNARATVITGSPAPKIRIKEASVDHETSEPFWATWSPSTCRKA